MSEEDVPEHELRPAWNPAAHPGLSAEYLWNTLCHLHGVRISVLTTDGRIVFADPTVETRYAPPGDSVVGKQLDELIDPKLAVELTKVVRDVVTQERPVVIQWVVRGVGVCSSVHPLPGDWNSQRIVLVATRDKVCGGDAIEVKDRFRVIKPKARDLGPLRILTRRELQILALIADGMSSAQIAERLERSVKTVEWHRVSIGQKLGLKSRIDLAQIGLIAGLGGDLKRLRESAGFIPAEREQEEAAADQRAPAAKRRGSSG